jgi:hypothetical protein
VAMKKYMSYKCSYARDFVPILVNYWNLICSEIFSYKCSKIAKICYIRPIENKWSFWPSKESLK